MSLDIGRVGMSTIGSGPARPIDSRACDGASRGRVQAWQRQVLLQRPGVVVDKRKSSPPRNTNGHAFNVAGGVCGGQCGSGVSPGPLDAWAVG
jgi:hypothetical protein